MAEHQYPATTTGPGQERRPAREPGERPARRGRALLTRLAALGSAAALAASAAVLLAAGSASAATCSGWSCHGHNPVTYDCAVSSTVTVPVDYDGTQVATLWNRYSYGCNANWGRAQLTSAGLAAHDSIIVLIYTTDSHKDFEEMCYPGPNNTGQLVEACSGTSYAGSLAAYSDMVDGTNTTTAEVGVYNSSGTRITMASAKQ